MKLPKILYFVDGVSPTPEDMQAALAMQAQVMFRNARAVPSEGPLEQCDGVAGKIPSSYAKAYPEAAEAIKSYIAELEKIAEKIGDRPAPKVSVKTKIADKDQTTSAVAPFKPVSPPAWTPNA